jgi:hypothetical protein
MAKGRVPIVRFHVRIEHVLSGEPSSERELLYQDSAAIQDKETVELIQARLRMLLAEYFASGINVQITIWED